MANKLRETRQSEALTITELAKLSEVSTKVISEIERELREGKVETRQKILRGLNRNPHRLQEWTYEAVFDSTL